MFSSIFENGTTIGMIALMAGLSVVFGVLYAFIASLKVRSSKGYFVTVALLPLFVSLGISLLALFLTDATTTNIGRIATIAITLGLVRFRSVNGKAEEMLLLIGSVVCGLVYGLGYVAYASIGMVVAALLFVLLIDLPIFKNKRFSKEKLLKITIPESLNYSDVFNDTFKHYLKEYEIVGVKTTGMGSMFRLSYRVVLKNMNEEKELIDEIRIRNGNLEINMLPYVEEVKHL